ncbi:GntR family transcriptional regulator [Micromonospora sp. M12]
MVNGIKRMILEGKFRPGDRLPIEKDLAEQLGVSRGPCARDVGPVDPRHRQHPPG